MREQAANLKTQFVRAKNKGRVRSGGTFRTARPCGRREAQIEQECVHEPLLKNHPALQHCPTPPCPTPIHPKPTPSQHDPPHPPHPTPPPTPPHPTPPHPTLPPPTPPHPRFPHLIGALSSPVPAQFPRAKCQSNLLESFACALARTSLLLGKLWGARNITAQLVENPLCGCTQRDCIAWLFLLRADVLFSERCLESVALVPVEVFFSGYCFKVQCLAHKAVQGSAFLSVSTKWLQSGRRCPSAAELELRLLLGPSLASESQGVDPVQERGRGSSGTSDPRARNCFLGDLRWVARFEPNRCQPN